MTTPVKLYCTLMIKQYAKQITKKTEGMQNVALLILVHSLKM